MDHVLGEEKASAYIFYRNEETDKEVQERLEFSLKLEERLKKERKERYEELKKEFG